MHFSSSCISDSQLDFRFSSSCISDSLFYFRFSSTCIRVSIFVHLYSRFSSTCILVSIFVHLYSRFSSTCILDSIFDFRLGSLSRRGPKVGGSVVPPYQSARAWNRTCVRVYLVPITVHWGYSTRWVARRPCRDELDGKLVCYYLLGPFTSSLLLQ